MSIIMTSYVFMNLCPNCSAKIIKKIPEVDNLERDVCSQCSEIFYSNPNTVFTNKKISYQRLFKVCIESEFISKSSRYFL